MNSRQTSLVTLQFAYERKSLPSILTVISNISRRPVHYTTGQYRTGRDVGDFMT